MRIDSFRIPNEKFSQVLRLIQENDQKMQCFAPSFCFKFEDHCSGCEEYELSTMLTKEQLIELMESISINKTLTHLNLDNQSCISEDGSVLQVISECLKENRTLKQLYLSWNDIDDNGAIILAELLKQNTTLEKLTLQNNKIGNQGLNSLLKGLQRNNTLNDLDLDSNHEIDENGVKLIASLLETNRSLTNIGLDLEMDDDKTKDFIRKRLEENQQIVANEKKKKIIQRVVEDDPNLKVVELDGRDFPDLSAQELTNIYQNLKTNTTVRKLDLSKRGLNKEDGREIAEILKQNSTLEILILYENDLEEEGIEYLAQGLKSNSTLRSLCIGSITKQGIDCLAEALKTNTTLVEIVLWHCPPDTKAQQKFIRNRTKENKRILESEFQC